jgi:hypothetical protein
MADPKSKPARARVAPDSFWMVATRTAAVLVYLAVVALCFTSNFGPRLFWTMALPLVPIGFVIAGFHAWRRVCPLAFFGLIGRRLGRKPRRVGKWVEQWFFVISFVFLAVMFVFRLVVINGDGAWMGATLIGVGLLAGFANAFYTGKTWCNFFCPVAVVERIYTEPNSLHHESNSQCATCTACKRDCPDIDQENAYWKNVTAKQRRFAFYAFPGLVLAFYTYYYLRAGNWEAYFDGKWTVTPASSEMLWGSGFYFWPQVPAVVAATLTLAGFSAISYGLFWMLERIVGHFVEDAERRDHIVFTIAAFSAFNVFYLFAGAPGLINLPGAPRLVAFVVPLVATLFLFKRLARTRGRYMMEKNVKRLLKKWDFEQEPPADPAEVFAFFKGHDQARAHGLAAYRESVVEALADGIITQDESNILKQLRAQLGISVKEHARITAAVAEDHKALFGPERIVSNEERIQIEGYREGLSNALMQEAKQDKIEALRRQWAVSTELHERIMADLLSAEGPLIKRARAQFKHIAEAREKLQMLVPLQDRPAVDFLIYVLLKRQDNLVDQVVDTLAVLGDASIVRATAPGLFARDSQTREAALESLRAASNAELVAHLEPIIQSRLPEGIERDATAVCAQLRQMLGDEDRYIRAGAAASLGTLAPVDAKAPLQRACADPDPFVKESAEQAILQASRDGGETLRAELTDSGNPGASSRYAAHRIEAGSFEGLSTMDRIRFLRAVPLFVDFDPDEMHELTEFTEEVLVSPPNVVCAQSEQSDDLYVVIEGAAAVTIESDGAEREVARLDVGQYFGELAAIDGSPRSATVKPIDSPVRLLRINSSAFRARLLSRTYVASKVMATLAERLRDALRRLAA